MATVIDKQKLVVNQPSSSQERVGRSPASKTIETYLRRVYDLFHGGQKGADVVFLLETFFFFKVGSHDNKINSAKQAVIGVTDFMVCTQTPPWHWSSAMLNEYLTELKEENKAPSTIRGRHHYIRDFCVSILADRDVANKLETKHGGSFQQITNAQSRALIRGFGKKKKVLANPTPNEMQRVLDNMEAEIIEIIETGEPTPYVRLRDRVIIAMFYAYGLRVTEMRKVDITHFDFDPECPNYGDYGILHVIGKGDKDRHLPILVDWVFPLLKTYVEMVRPHWSADMSIAEKDRNALFFSNNRTRLSITSLQRIVKTAFKRAGIKKNVSPHRLRNGCLTRVMDEVGLSQAKKIGGHSFAATTEGYYDKKASLAGDALSNHVKNIYKKQHLDE